MYCDDKQETNQNCEAQIDCQDYSRNCKRQEKGMCENFIFNYTLGIFIFLLDIEIFSK